jgi:hypothetical protein
MVDRVRDEVLDIVEGISLAEDKEEIFEHVLDVIDRNKGLIFAVGGGFFLKTKVFGAAAANTASISKIRDLQAQEAAKWGRRAI